MKSDARQGTSAAAWSVGSTTATTGLSLISRVGVLRRERRRASTAAHWLWRVFRFSRGWTTSGQPPRSAVTHATTSKAIRWGSIPEGEEGKLREQFDLETVLLQRVSTGGGQDKSEHALGVASETQAKASLDRQGPGNRTTCVGTGVAPEAVESLASRDSEVDNLGQTAVHRAGAACAAR